MMEHCKQSCEILGSGTACCSLRKTYTCICGFHAFTFSFCYIQSHSIGTWARPSDSYKLVLVGALLNERPKMCAVLPQQLERGTKLDNLAYIKHHP
jgi:hypothetical protein